MVFYCGNDTQKYVLFVHLVVSAIILFICKTNEFYQEGKMESRRCSKFSPLYTEVMIFLKGSDLNCLLGPFGFKMA